MAGKWHAATWKQFAPAPTWRPSTCNRFRPENLRFGVRTRRTGGTTLYGAQTWRDRNALLHGSEMHQGACRALGYCLREGSAIRGRRPSAGQRQLGLIIDPCLHLVGRRVHEVVQQPVAGERKVPLLTAPPVYAVRLRVNLEVGWDRTRVAASVGDDTTAALSEGRCPACYRCRLNFRRHFNSRGGSRCRPRMV